MLQFRPTILLDLDGTLVDPTEGIIGSCQRALADLRSSVPSANQLRWIIGPSIRTSFARLLGEGADIETAVSIYRQYYSDWGLTKAHVYRGIHSLLAAHVAKGTRLLVCTAKYQGFARRVVDHFELSQFLAGVYGPELDGRREDKGDLMAYLLEQEGLCPEEVYMVGDREHDILAARRHGISSVGVLCGYGSRSELEKAGARYIAEHPRDLLPN